MNLSALRNQVKAALQPSLVKLEAIPSRDRAALLFCTVAVVCGTEFMVLTPMANKRTAVASAGDQEAKAAADAATQQAQAKLDELQALRAHAAQAERDNADQGVTHVQGESVAALLERALRNQGAKTVSLRSLGSQEITPESASAALDGAAANSAHGAAALGATAHGAAAAGASAPGATPTRSLYRHRYELILSGDAPALSASAGALETGLAPLRIERARLVAGQAHGLNLVLTFGLIGSERSWLIL